MAWIYVPGLSTEWPSAPESMASGEDWNSSFPPTELSLQLNSRPIRRQSWSKISKRKPFLRFLYGTISEPSMATRGVESWIALLRASRARTCLVPARAQESTVPDPACSLKLSASFAKWDPTSSSWRTSQPSSDGDCPRYSKRLPNSGIGIAGELWKQPMLEPLTIGSAGSSSLWPTASASIAQDGEDPITWRARREILKLTANNGNGAGVPLTVRAVEVSRQLWPTAVANDDNKSLEAHMAMKARMPGGPRKTITSLTVMAKAWTERVLWSTASAVDYKGPNPDRDRPKGNRDLPTDAVAMTRRMWHTAHGAGNVDHTGKLGSGGELSAQAVRCPSDCLPSLQDPTTSTSGEPSSPSIPGWLLPSSGRLQLNPVFVTWLMGLPLGTTCVCAPVQEQNGSRHLAIRSCRCRQRSHICNCSNDLGSTDAA